MWFHIATDSFQYHAINFLNFKHVILLYCLHCHIKQKSLRLHLLVEFYCHFMSESAKLFQLILVCVPDEISAALMLLLCLPASTFSPSIARESILLSIKKHSYELIRAVTYSIILNSLFHQISLRIHFFHSQCY